MTTTLNSIDHGALSRGDGDWRNMQEVTRRTFLAMLDHMKKQESELNSLTQTVSKLKKQIGKKADIDEINTFVSTGLSSHPMFNSIGVDLNNLNDRVVQIYKEVEKKANNDYVDTSLKKKMNKLDIDKIIRSFGNAKNEPSESRLNSMELNLTMINQRLADVVTTSDYKKLHSLQEELAQNISLKADKRDIAFELDMKVAT